MRSFSIINPLLPTSSNFNSHPSPSFLLSNYNQLNLLILSPLPPSLPKLLRKGNRKEISHSSHEGLFFSSFNHSLPFTPSLSYIWLWTWDFWFSSPTFPRHSSPAVTELKKEKQVGWNEAPTRSVLEMIPLIPYNHALIFEKR